MIVINLAFTYLYIQPSFVRSEAKRNKFSIYFSFEFKLLEEFYVFFSLTDYVQ